MNSFVTRKILIGKALRLREKYIKCIMERTGFTEIITAEELGRAGWIDGKFEVQLRERG